MLDKQTTIKTNKIYRCPERKVSKGFIIACCIITALATLNVMQWYSPRVVTKNVVKIKYKTKWKTKIKKVCPKVTKEKYLCTLPNGRKAYLPIMR